MDFLTSSGTASKWCTSDVKEYGGRFHKTIFQLFLFMSALISFTHFSHNFCRTKDSSTREQSIFPQFHNKSTISDASSHSMSVAWSRKKQFGNFTHKYFLLIFSSLGFRLIDHWNEWFEPVQRRVFCYLTAGQESHEKLSLKPLHECSPNSAFFPTGKSIILTVSLLIFSHNRKLNNFDAPEKHPKRTLFN